jgi:hypothetical protein
MRGRVENYRPRRRFWLPAMRIHVFNMHQQAPMDECRCVIEKMEMALASFSVFARVRARVSLSRPARGNLAKLQSAPAIINLQAVHELCMQLRVPTG